MEPNAHVLDGQSHTCQQTRRRVQCPTMRPAVVDCHGVLDRVRPGSQRETGIDEHGVRRVRHGAFDSLSNRTEPRGVCWRKCVCSGVLELLAQSDVLLGPFGVSAAHLYRLVVQSGLVHLIVLLIHEDSHDAALGQLNKLATRRDVRSAEINLAAHQPGKQLS
jgi:hypothetical protein